MSKQKLVWEEKYSVKVAQIDAQHKKMFETINLLIDTIAGVPKKEQIDIIINELVEYKKIHFLTEETLFEKFNYPDKEEHILKHKQFGEKLELLVKESNGDSMVLAFNLIDFLEDWLLDHLMTVDQKYVSCFQEHGLT